MNPTRYIPVNSILERLLNVVHTTGIKLPKTLCDTSQIRKPLIIPPQNFHNINLNKLILYGPHREKKVTTSVVSRQHIMSHNNQLATCIQTSIDIDNVRKIVETITILSTNPLVVFDGEYILYDVRSLNCHIPVYYSKEHSKYYRQIFSPDYPFFIP